MAQERGALVDVDAVFRLFARTIHVHNAQAEQLEDRVRQLLPKKLKAEDRNRVLDGVRTAVQNLRNGMADAATEWAREAQERPIDDCDAEPGG